ncbi:MAG: Gfo/Idh/MocA family oxidoreductase [Deltaproteobacteria bacterium]|nr:Gfo/Idh/MocA family oxidoreductase [Deltaproteobacteria bacterium]
MTNRFQFSHRLQKLFFFLFREGPTLAWSKVKASLLQQSVIAERAVVIVYGTDSLGEMYFAVGPQDVPRADTMSFLDEWCFPVADGGQFEEFQSIVASYFNQNPEHYFNLFHFSPLAGHNNYFCLANVLAEKGVSGDLTSRVGIGTKGRGFPNEECKVRDQHITRRGINLFLAGAGAYACAYILPNVKRFVYHSIIDLNPCLAAVVGERYGFRYRETSYRRALERLRDCPEPVLVIATYHSTHVEIAEEGLFRNSGTRIFLEKPPVTDHDQLRRLLDLRSRKAFIEIGYNRRYAPMALKAAELIKAKGGGPVIMTCIIKELALPSYHWYYWPSQGTRVTGNLCHWIDLGTALIDASPKMVTVVSAVDARPGDELTVTVTYDDGSRLNLVATDHGNPLRGVQEYIDIRRGDLTVAINDFLVMTTQEGGRQRVHRSVIRDKGHTRMYRDFSRRVQTGAHHSYPDQDLLVSSTIYLAVVKCVKEGLRSVSLKN